MVNAGPDVRTRFDWAYELVRRAVRQCERGKSFRTAEVVDADWARLLVGVHVERDDVLGDLRVVWLDGEMADAVRPGLERRMEEEWWGSGYQYVQWLREYVPAEDGLRRWMRGG